MPTTLEVVLTTVIVVFVFLAMVGRYQHEADTQIKDTWEDQSVMDINRIFIGINDPEDIGNGINRVFRILDDEIGHEQACSYLAGVCLNAPNVLRSRMSPGFSMLCESVLTRCSRPHSVWKGQ